MSNQDTSHHIAIVGMSCRLPGADTPAQYWQNLQQGRDARRTLSAEELAAADPALVNHPDHVPVAYTLDQVDGFDASFFYLNAAEAEKMDPQLRVWLETAWHALEDAGYSSERYDGDIGVYAAGLGNTYLAANLLTSSAHYHGDVGRMLGDLVARMGNDSHYLATRTAYHLNLTGPSMAVQSACSSSLVAVHQAVAGLLAGECDMAMAGGVSIRFPRLSGYQYQPGGILSPDGFCRPFDADAAGTVFGDGAGVVVLKRLADALADGDTIHAVVLGSAVGNDGSDKVGYAAPGSAGQIRVVEQALQVAGVDKDSISYIEAHGTGTAVGDPIEVQALRAVYDGVAPAHKIALGSVKGNVGHLSIAAGVAGLIKTVLMLKHRTMVATLHFRTPHPACTLAETPFWVPQASAPWGDADAPLRAGVSSFGMGGSNCHLVLEQAPPAVGAAPSRPLSLIPISAKSPQALEVALRNAAACLREAQGDPALADLAHTYAKGRRTFNYRQVVVAENAEEAIAALSGHTPGQVISGHGQPAPQPVVFMFPGQGAQHSAMTQGVYEHEALFRGVVDECCAKLAGALEMDLRALLYPALFPGADAGLLNQTRYTQPALFVVEYALARLWMSWGVVPAALIGHSVGEYVAACLAGVFDLDTALRLVALRGRLVQAMPAGAMAAVPLGRAALLARLPQGIELAASNEPGACTVAGARDALRAFVAALSEEGIQARMLVTSHAFHSAMMEPAAAQLREAMAGMLLRAPRTPVVSNLTGSWLSDDQACSPEYWASHLRHSVQFAEGAAFLLQQQAQQILLEVGPGQTLASFVRRHPDKEVSHQVLSSLGRIKQPQDEYRSLIGALGRIWAAGLEPDWRAYYAGERRRRVGVPVYPFEHERFYAQPSNDYRSIAAAPGSDAKQPLANWCYAPVWQQVVNTVAARPAPFDAAPYLVFADEAGVGGSLAGLLEQGGARAIVVRHGSELVLPERDGMSAALRLGHKEDYLALLRALRQQQRLPDTVFHLWSMDAPYAGMDREKFELAQSLGIYSIAYLTQACAELNITHAMRWQLVTCSAYPVSGAERLRPEQSTASVFAKVISQEYAQIDCRLLDIGELADAADAPAAALCALREVTLDSPREYGVAQRSGRRWVQQMARIAQVSDWDMHGCGALAEQGVYLITGGLGEIGTTLARTLARQYRARLGLLVREPMPPRAEWENHAATAAPDDLVARRIRTVHELEALGADVLVVQADVAEPDAMKAALAQLVQRFGRLDGVFHAAGLPGEKWDRTLENAGPDEIRWHFQSKAYGVQVLAQVLEPLRPAFCVFISSIASMLGGLRLGPYGAANHYMDGAAVWLGKQQPHTRWVAIDWDVWQHHQDEKRESSSIGKMMDGRTVLPEQGMETIARVLAMREVCQVAVSTWDMAVRAQRWIERLELDGGRGTAGKVTAVEADQPLALAVLALLNQTLGRDVLQMEDDFFEAGGDSLISLQLLSTVRERYGVNVSLAKFLAQPSAASLTSLISAQLAPEVDVLDLIERELGMDQEVMVRELIAAIRAMDDSAVRAALA